MTHYAQQCPQCLKRSSKVANTHGTCAICIEPLRAGAHPIAWSKRADRNGNFNRYHFDCFHQRNCGAIFEPAVVEPATPDEPTAPEPAPVEPPAPIPPPDEPAPVPVAPRPTQTLRKERPPMAVEGNGLASVIAEAIWPSIEERLASTVDEERVREIVADAVKGHVGRTEITVVRPDGTKHLAGNGKTHRLFPVLLDHLAAREHVALYGKPGGGKTTAARQAAQSLGLEFGYISLNQRTSPTRLEGFIGADGTSYFSPTFRRLFEHGGVFLFDEMDNAPGDVLTAINAALENGHAAFPDGNVARHENFVAVGCMNTIGLGPTPSHPDRRALDAATRDRFSFVAWDYDTTLEREVATADDAEGTSTHAWVDWVFKVRDYCEEHYPRTMVTPRASIRGCAALRRGNSPAECANRYIWKGLDKDSVSRIVGACPLPTVRV